MSTTMFDYIAEQKESFDEKSFTPADAAILSTVANINLSYFYNEHDTEYIPLAILAVSFASVCNKEKPSQEYQLMKMIADSPRYGNILVSNVVDEIDKGEEKQFGAITFYPQPDLAYVGFAGTGTSVVGYKEDLNMAFMDIVPSQREAVNYLNNMENKLPEEIIVGGFSKGGNLAVFASAFCKPEIREKIKTVYNHDGPGFSDLILNEPKYQSLKPLIKIYIPKDSIVGVILNHDNNFRVIDSVAAPFMQHQPYAWVFEGDNLKVIDEPGRVSTLYRRVQKQLLKTMEEEKRKETVDALFDFIGSVEPDDFLNLVSGDRKVSSEFRTAWKQLNRNSKKMIRRFLRLLAYSFYKSMGSDKESKKAYRKEKKQIKRLKKLD